MFNQCIRFGEGGVRPTHSIQAIARTKSLSWVSLQWNGTDPSFLRQPENVNQSSTWWDDGTYFSNSRELSIGYAIHRFQCTACSGAVSKISICCLFSLCPLCFSLRFLKFLFCSDIVYLCFRRVWLSLLTCSQQKKCFRYSCIIFLLIILYDMLGKNLSSTSKVFFHYQFRTTIQSCKIILVAMNLAHLRRNIYQTDKLTQFSAAYANN